MVNSVGALGAGRDGLADEGDAVDHDAVDRRVDRAAGEVDFGGIDGGLLDQHLGLRLGELGFGLIKLGLETRFCSRSLRERSVSSADEVEIGGGVGESGLGGAEAGLVGGGVELGQDLALFDGGVVVDVDFDDQARNLAGDVDRGDGLKATGGGDDLLDVAAGDFCGGRTRGLFGARLHIIPSPGAAGGEESESDNEAAGAACFGHNGG